MFVLAFQLKDKIFEVCLVFQFRGFSVLECLL